MNLIQAANAVRTGQSVSVRPSGHSMTPIIRHRQQVTISPIQDDSALKENAVVLVKVKGNWLLHRIARTGAEQYQIANARGRVNGWVRRQAIAGIVTEIHPNT